MSRGTSGTLVYMSPQQLDGEHASELDDIYSLGATIYELLTGKPPFYSGQIDRLVREKIPPTMAKRRADLGVTSTTAIPQHWEVTVAACLAKDPVARPQSALELKEKLLAPAVAQITVTTLPGTGLTTRPPAKAEAPPLQLSWIRQHPLLAVVAGSMIAFLVLAVVWFVDRPARQEPTPVPEPKLTPAPSTVPHVQPPASSPVASAEPSIPTPTPPPSSPPPVYVPLPPPTTSTGTTATEQIQQFVAEHFRKTERLDCDGVLADYASRVDYFDNGVVGKDFIARDCSGYIKSWPEIMWQITGPIEVRESGAGDYTVSFGYDFEARNKAKAKISRGHAAYTWRVENRLGRFQITYHRETITRRTAR
jgi:serine/threonine protein kinase